ncbi:MAG: tRNA epoxyqueuosine(34) reductase QueG, partial [Cyclobacteriaceae bacterium]|nr:tRNA epoxyqueuosine(34) reductase QueG [Cyclobacteriaceae bacterium]
MKVLTKKEISQLVKALAHELGFSACGIARAGFLEDEAPKFTRWLEKGYQGTMTYMENHFDKRLDPTKLVPGSKSVVMLLYNYYPEKTLPEKNNFKIARYAYGEDYHFVIKTKLKALVEAIREKAGDVEGRAFVDSAPVLERVWAQKAGLGWIGKNTLLLKKKKGSFFFLAELIIDLEMEYDTPATDHCGSCTACLDACPTGALIAPYTLDSRKCISFLTIEL